MLSCPYQVGDIYITTSSTNPQTKWSWTTWERYAAGRTLVGYNSSDSTFSTVGNTGGEKTHTLTVSEMPKHNHDPQDSIRAFVSTSGSGYTGLRYGSGSTFYLNGFQMNGGGAAHNNLQPYIVTYIWRRTA